MLNNRCIVRLTGSNKIGTEKKASQCAKKYLKYCHDDFEKEPSAYGGNFKLDYAGDATVDPPKAWDDYILDNDIVEFAQAMYSTSSLRDLSKVNKIVRIFFTDINRGKKVLLKAHKNKNKIGTTILHVSLHNYYITTLTTYTTKFNSFTVIQYSGPMHQKVYRAL
jgi:hypothetical protein